MNIVLWIIAAVLAVAFLAAGAMKLAQPKPKLLDSGMGWVEDFSTGAVKAIGALEVLAAVGLILPAVLDIAPVLVPVTAACVALLFVGAVTMRARRGESVTVAPDLVYLAMAVFVAWGRFGPASFTG
jgi:uncharacterized membrane protein YphA (DoxX/SURF4 family)